MIWKQSSGWALVRLCLLILAAVVCLMPSAASSPCTVDYPAGLVVSGGKTITIDGQVCCVRGNIIVEAGAKLIIRDSTLTVAQDYNWQYDVRIEGNGTLEMSKTSVQSSRAVQIVGLEDAVLTLSEVTGSDPWRVMLCDRSSAFLDGVNIMEVNLSGSPSMTVARSTIRFRVELSLEGPCDIKIIGVRPGHFDDWDLSSSVSSLRPSLALSLRDTDIGNWSVSLSRNARAVISDSELVAVSLGLSGTSGTVAGLRPGSFQRWSSGGLGLHNATCALDLENTSVSEWVLEDGSDCSLNVQDSEVSLVLWGDNLSLSGLRSLFPWTSVSHSRAQFAMQDCTFSNYLRLADANVSLSGTVHFEQPLEIGGWHASSVRRAFEVLVRNAKGEPAARVAIRVMDPTGREVSKGTTTADGRFLFQVTFGDDTHSKTWKLAVPDYGVTKSFSFLTDTPLVVQVP